MTGGLSVYLASAFGAFCPNKVKGIKKRNNNGVKLALFIKR
jgi:hypothetical protein